ncbi:MAG: glycogen-binding domain-containing protein [Elusimicrobiota bacterium]
MADPQEQQPQPLKPRDQQGRDKTKLQIIIVLSLSVSFLSGYTAAYRYHRLERKRTQDLLKAKITRPVTPKSAGLPQGPTIIISSQPVGPPPALDIEKAKTAVDTKSLLPRHILFTCVNYRAKEVFLAGEFNSWSPIKMNKEKPGTWRAGIEITPGTYRYHYLVEGKKTPDQYNPRREGNSSILIIEPLK